MTIVPPNDPALWNKAMRVENIESEVRPYLTDMWRLMTEVAPDAVAMSAPQVGLPLRFFITNGRWAPGLVVNPVILLSSTEKVVATEGCLTWPGRSVNVPRSEWVNVKFTNINGHERTDLMRGLAARIFQHEIDHLDGRCIFPRP